MYLKSKIAQVIIKKLSLGGAEQRLSLRNIPDVDVIVPSRPDSFYKRVFELETSKSQTIDVFQQYIVDAQLEETNTLEDFLNKEIFEKIKTIKNQNLAAILKEDLKEIKACCRVKAYKATLILCGSVLEAFILDWLNELEPKEDWLNKRTYKNKQGKECIAGLDYYIGKIAKISTPPWMKVHKDNANLIKNNRNLVHAKLCLKEDIKINQQICREVISYLEEIIKLR